MKVHLDNVNLSSSSGPNSFALRLTKALFEEGHSVVDDGHNADVSLVFIERSGAPLAKKVIQRLDGIWFSPSEFLLKNKPIKTLYVAADHVIWQSNFDRSMTTKWWSSPKRGTVIHNGIQIEPIKHFSAPGLENIRKEYEYVFVCSANWHGQKRLKTNIDVFFHLRSILSPKKCCIIVLGAHPDHIVSDKDIFYGGTQSHSTCMEIYSMSDWMIHMAWCDHCPNSVVEALSQETPVICSDTGGTVEIVKDFGIILREHKKYNFELCEYDRPPEIPVSQIESLPEKNALGKHVDVDIRNVVKSYVDVFSEVLSS